MAKDAQSVRSNRDFLGQTSNLDPLDVPEGGAVKQVNVTCQVNGELRVRRGYRQVEWEN